MKVLVLTVTMMVAVVVMAVVMMVVAVVVMIVRHGLNLRAAQPSAQGELYKTTLAGVILRIEVNMRKALNFIGGEFMGAAGGSHFVHHNPSTGEPASEVAKSEVLDLVRAIQGANIAWAFWSKVEAKGRSELLSALSRHLAEKKEHFAALESAETGVPFAVVLASVQRAALVLEFFSQAIVNDRQPSSSAEFYESRDAIGVVGIITSWVEATFGIASRVGAALAAGNVVILKPSSRAPMTAMAFAEAVAHVTHDYQLRTTGLPSGFSAGFLSLLQGRGVEVGEALVSHPGISTIAFIGKTETGRKIQIAAAEFLKRVQLSLSGCNSILVFADCDLEATVQRVIQLSLTSETSAAFRGMRVFVQDPIYKEFARLLSEQSSHIQIGSSSESQTQLGPLPSDADRGQFFASVQKAVEEKGKLLFGGSKPGGSKPGGSKPVENLARGYFVSPTAIMDLTNCSTLHQEEVIGPLLLLNNFKYQGDAIKFANGSPFGQVCYLFHRDLEKASRIAMAIQAGRVLINPDGMMWDPRHPAEGMKASGLGGVEGRAGLEFFTRLRVIGQVVGQVVGRDVGRDVGPVVGPGLVS